MTEPSLVVQKYGGTSVGSAERIRHVARRALATQAEGRDVVLIVSAMAGETNRLLTLAGELSDHPSRRELDVIAATGEQVSSALTALAIQELGGKARSLLGHQLKIRTDGAFTKARILAIDPHALHQCRARGEIAVVAGFQGVDDDGNITTLGRGGSDTSAVAVAAAIGADVCEICTDVDGVYTTDPNICPRARKIATISYEEMLELASLGAKVLQIRSVELAMKWGVPLVVRSSFHDAPGTLVIGKDMAAAEPLERVVVQGVACDESEARVMIIGVEDRPGIVAQLFGQLAAENISVDMIIQTPSHGDGSERAPGPRRTDVTFTCSKTDVARVGEVAAALVDDLGARDVRFEDRIAKVSIVGFGMRSHAGVAARMFDILAQESINIDAISTSEIKISCIVADRYAELAVRALHDGFQLDQPPSSRPRASGAPSSGAQ
ncbi:MAG: aspartate kinase [Myxococcota bacterium]